MKTNHLLIGICLLCCITACNKPPVFDLNAPYKDVTVVYGVLNHQDSIHYVKIYKGFQSHEKEGVYKIAQNPDSIYYHNSKSDTSLITVVLQEFNGDKRTSRKDILLNFTHNFVPPRDSGFFYYGKESIIYYTKEPLSKDYSYKIIIKHKVTGKITEGMTKMLGNGTDGNEFEIYSAAQMINILGKKGSVSFYPAQYATDYEFLVNFLYFEVDNKSKEITRHKIVKNICPRVGEKWVLDKNGYYLREYPFTFYDDIAARVKPNSNVTRYAGSPTSKACIEIVGWAGEGSMINYLLSNQPTSSFVEVSNIFTNLTVTHGDGFAFGFLSSRVKCPIRTFSISQECEDSLVKGPKTYDLNFKHWIDFKN